MIGEESELLSSKPLARISMCSVTNACDLSHLVTGII